MGTTISCRLSACLLVNRVSLSIVSARKSCRYGSHLRMSACQSISCQETSLIIIAYSTSRRVMSSRRPQMICSLYRSTSNLPHQHTQHTNCTPSHANFHAIVPIGASSVPVPFLFPSILTPLAVLKNLRRRINSPLLIHISS